MFPRIATVKRGDKTYRYLQIVEAYRVDGRTTQRVVANLGRLDQLDGKLDDLLVALSVTVHRVRTALRRQERRFLRRSIPAKSRFLRGAPRNTLFYRVATP